MNIEGKSLISILSYITTISFWTQHIGFWFIALIIPLYLISPFLYRFLFPNGVLKFLILLLICNAISLIPNFLVSTNDQIFHNIQFAIVRIPSFILGMVLAPMIINEKKVSQRLIGLLIFIAILLLLVTKHFVYTYVFMVIPFLWFFSFVLDKYKDSIFYRIGIFFGKISLESYLFNGAIQIYIIWFIDYFALPDYNNILMYSLVVSLGTILSVIFHKISVIITNYINTNLLLAI